MRIIGGSNRGRRVNTFRDPGVLRPISGRIKQSLFDIVGGLVPDSRWLDLFAGTGAVGFEALSRGAAFAAFVDNDRRSVKAIEETIAHLGLHGRAKVWRGNALEDLSWVAYHVENVPFDVVFLGPPYKDEEKRPLAYSTPTISRVAAAGLLKPSGILISQHHAREVVVAPDGMKFLRREKYGDTCLSFYKKR